MLSRRTRRGPLTGSLKTPVKTVFPRHETSFGMPTLTDRRVPTVARVSVITRRPGRARGARSAESRAPAVRDEPVQHQAGDREDRERPEGSRRDEHELGDHVHRDDHDTGPARERVAGPYAEAHEHLEHADGEDDPAPGLEVADDVLGVWRRRTSTSRSPLCRR